MAYQNLQIFPLSIMGADFSSPGIGGGLNRTYTLPESPALSFGANLLKSGSPLRYGTDYTITGQILLIKAWLDDSEDVIGTYYTGLPYGTFSGTTYCTPEDVKRILQKTVSFSPTTTPTEDEVGLTINQVEDWIDRYTHHAWREVAVSNEYYDIPEVPYNYSTGLPIFLRHRQIHQFSHATGDKIEMWNGSEWIDWLATRTEGRNTDFWADYEQGVLYVRNPFAYHTKKALRLSCRYGESTVPADIRDACALLAAASIIESDDRSMVVNETGDVTRMSHDSRVDKWTNRAMALLSNRREIGTW